MPMTTEMMFEHLLNRLDTLERQNRLIADALFAKLRIARIENVHDPVLSAL